MKRNAERKTAGAILSISLISGNFSVGAKMMIKDVLIFLGAAVILGTAFTIYFNWLHSQPRPRAAHVQIQKLLPPALHKPVAYYA